MSIQPEYADKILRGDKTVEFRRKRIRSDIAHVLMYATAPRHMLVGAFEVCCVDEATPDELWIRYASRGGISEETYRAYFGSSSRGFAIQIGRVFTLQEPAPLQELDSNLHAPQSYCYVGETMLQVLLSKTS
jgi:predicted transcriptional regulator